MAATLFIEQSPLPNKNHAHVLRRLAPFPTLPPDAGANLISGR